MFYKFAKNIRTIRTIFRFRKRKNQNSSLRINIEKEFEKEFLEAMKRSFNVPLVRASRHSTFLDSCLELMSTSQRVSLSLSLSLSVSPPLTFENIYRKRYSQV